jgi:hypothetical protein
MGDNCCLRVAVTNAQSYLKRQQKNVVLPSWLLIHKCDKLGYLEAVVNKEAVHGELL